MKELYQLILKKWFHSHTWETINNVPYKKTINNVMRLQIHQVTGVSYTLRCTCCGEITHRIVAG